MDNILVFLLGVAVGVYTAEDVREVAPVLEPKEKVNRRQNDEIDL